MKHVDPLDDNKQMAFTNVILQCAPVTQYDSNGYMQFNILNSTGEATISPEERQFRSPV